MRPTTFIIIATFLLIALGATHVSAQEATVCCEQTNSGAFCQNVPAEECAPGAQQLPTSCDSTSFCRAGTCFDSTEGTCLDNTPQLVCNDNGGIWSEERPPQCDLGCCILGDQAAFVSLVRCKKLSADLGLETYYDSSIQTETACIETVQSQDTGACVFDFEFQRTCTFTTRAECDSLTQAGANGTVSPGEFYKDLLCSAEELGTICGPTTETTCVPGKDGVYFVDTCGNPANIYDASRVDDQEYWRTVIQRSESCDPNSGNALDASCGNCNYLLGSICREQGIADGNPTYGDYICADLSCSSTSNGDSYLHGESWCVFNDHGEINEGENSVGSRFHRHICVNGEEIVEPCGDFRSEICIEDDINGFSQAGCRVNRWQDCTSQIEQIDCENTDQRDCRWVKDVAFGNRTENDDDPGACLPLNPPGLNFWEDSETQAICAQADHICVVTYEKGIFGGEECVDNCHCLEDEYRDERNELCVGLGDCGPGTNWIGQEGNKDGFKIIVGDEPEDQ